METNPLQQQISFLREIEKLKVIARNNKTLDSRFENSAEHSWHVAIMGLLLEEHAENSLDMLRVTKLLLIHDIVEIDVGDISIYESNQDSKAQEEREAAHRIFSILPDPQKEEYLSLWIEFEERSTEEAKFASVIDGIQPLLNHLLTGDPQDGVIPEERVRSKKEYIARYAPKLWDLVEELIEQSKSKGLYA